MHNRLARSHTAERQFGRAVQHYRQALQINSDVAAVHVDLANALAKINQLAQAIQHLRRALGLEPGHAKAHYNLAVALRVIQRFDEAFDHFEQALKLRPDQLGVLNGTARLLATHPDETRRDPAHAVILATQATTRTEFQDPQILDTLAAAGDFENAVATARSALDVASEKRADEINKRLQLYLQKKAFYLPPPSANAAGD